MLDLFLLQGQFVDSYDPTIENTFNKNIKLRNQVKISGTERLRFEDD